VHRAEELLDEVESLANRGAAYAARRDYLRVLRLIAQSLDAQLGQQYHAPALVAGLRALEEADDFAAATQPDAESDVQLSAHIEGHRTPVLKSAPPNTLTPLVAMQRYYEYAYAQLTLAGGREGVASRALCLLGRAEAQIAQRENVLPHGGPKALVLFRAALAVDATNSRAANEMGVMLARRGRMAEAVEVLEHAAQTAPTPIALANLAAIYGRTGNMQAAQRVTAQAQHLAAAAGQPLGSVVQAAAHIQWVEPAAFSRMTPFDGWSNTADQRESASNAHASSPPTMAAAPYLMRDPVSSIPQPPTRNAAAGAADRSVWWY
jgi:tetratricopeptide (TPR) repeat protein